MHSLFIVTDLVDDYRDLLGGSHVIVGQDFEGGWEGLKVAFELT